MQLTEQLKSLLNEVYTSEDGDEYKIKLRPGLTNKEIDNLTERIGVKGVPTDIRVLLQLARGFDSYGQEITFDGYGFFGMDNIFPYTVQLTGDGFGNFWIADLDAKGNWGNIFYACHDPAVIVKQADNLSQFLQQLDEYGKDISNSLINTIHEKTVHNIWKDDNSFIPIETARNAPDEELRRFAATLPDNFIIADLRDKPNKAGFAWGKFGPNIDKAVRHDTQLIWGIERPKKKGSSQKRTK